MQDKEFQVSKKTQLLLKCAQQAVSEAIERHRRLGESIVIWRDGKIVTLTADEIPPQFSETGNGLLTTEK